MEEEPNLPHKLAGFHHGKPYVSKRVPSQYRTRLMIHQKTYLKAKRAGLSQTEAVAKARRAEHRGMSKHQVHVYEGKLGSLARRR